MAALKGMSRTSRATLIALAIAGLIFAVAMIAHSRGQNDTQIVAIPLDPNDPDRNRIGDLEYLGGLDIPPMGQNIGGLSGLRWDVESGRLLAITDDARWVWIKPVENEGRLVGVTDFESGNFLDLEGEALTGKERGDSESLTRSADGGWLVGFERDHRIWRYAQLSGIPVETAIDPTNTLGQMESNGGVEALARSEANLILCAERQASEDKANCAIHFGAGLPTGPLPVRPTSTIEALGGVPTDADHSDDEMLFFLFRSYSSADGNGTAIVALRQSGTRREIATVRPPLTVDNFEGIAVRQEGEGDNKRTFLYIVSDGNFSANQRTLLMKFEVLPEGG